MAEYIERETAKAKIREKFKFVPARIEINEVLNSIPAADVRPVVLCRDCMLRQYCKFAQYLGEDGFCSNGEKREES